MTTEWTMEAVQEGLIQAWEILRRMPDREAGWLRSGASSMWRQVQREWSAYSQDGDDVRLTLGLRAAEVDQMEAALGWLEMVRPEDRRLIGAVLPILAKGYSRIPWRRIRGRLGTLDSPKALQMRYQRALATMNAALNVGPKSRTFKSIQKIDIG